MFNQGLLGNIGLFGNQPDSSQMSLLGSLYDPAEESRLMARRGLLAAGLSMLKQGPSSLPINFGTSLGQGLSAGMEAADSERQNYRNNAFDMYGLKNAADERAYQHGRDAKSDARNAANDAWTTRTHARQEGDWRRDDQQRGYLDQMIGSVPEADRPFARAFPQQYAQQKFQQQFDSANGGAFYGNPVPYTDAQGNYGVGMLGKDGRPVAVPPPVAGGKWMDPYSKAFKTSQGTTEGKNTGDVNSDLPITDSNYQSVIKQIDELALHPGLQTSVGTVQGNMPTWALSQYEPAVADFRSRLEQLKGGAFLQAYETLKGGGAIANAEGQKAEQAKARMQMAVTENDFLTALQDYKDAVTRGYEAIYKKAGKEAPDVQEFNWTQDKGLH